MYVAYMRATTKSRLDIAADTANVFRRTSAHSKAQMFSW